jgi:hypothetical protein
MRDKSVVRLSVTPSTKYSCSGSPPRLAKGRTTMERCGDVQAASGLACAGCRLRANTPGSARRCSSGSTSRDRRPRNPTSVLPQRPDLADQAGHVGFVPTTDSCTAAKELLLDHLVTRASRPASPAYRGRLTWRCSVRRLSPRQQRRQPRGECLTSASVRENPPGRHAVIIDYPPTKRVS